MKRLIVISLLASLGAGCASAPQKPQSAEFVKQSKFLAGSTVREFKLKNGLRIVLLEDHSAPLVTYQTWIQAGSRDELSGKTGLAHLFEHMMFRETTHMKNGEFAQRVAEMGGGAQLNANTYMDRTSYYTSLPSQNLEEYIRLEADRFENLKISQDLLDNERGAVLGEYNMNKDRPGRRLYDELFKAAFLKSPYRITTIGLKEDIESFTVEDCLKFYKTYYAPNNAIIVVVGDFEENAVLDMIQKYYGSFSPKSPPPRNYAKEPEQHSARNVNVKMNVQSEHFILAYKTPDILHKDQAALSALAAVLSTGQSSPLHKKLVDKSIVKSIEAFVFQFNLPGLFVFEGEMTERHKAPEAIQAILQEIEKIANGQVRDSDLARAKNQYKLEILDGLKRNISKGSIMGESASSANGDYLRGVQILEELDKVTASEVQRVAKVYLNTSSQTIVRLMPEK